MTPSEYSRYEQAWRKKERRKMEYVATLGIITNRSMGGDMQLSDLLEDETEK